MATTGATGGDIATSRPGVGRAARRLRTETKAAFKTTEFWAMIGLIVASLNQRSRDQRGRQRNR